jgi:hypothetical protein
MIGLEAGQAPVARKRGVRSHWQPDHFGGDKRRKSKTLLCFAMNLIRYL